MSSVARLARRTFASLEVPNYRRFFGGQVVSITGTWVQIVAEMWLVVQLTGSGVYVGLTAAFQFLPVLVFGPWGGVLADRMSKRQLLSITQILMALPPLALWALTASGTAEIWMVYGLVLFRGSANALDNPARNSLAIELVGGDRIVNAVSLNSLVIQATGVVGPALAGALIALVGVAPCFLLNALSFAVMFVALQSIDDTGLHKPSAGRTRGSEELMATLREVKRRPELKIPLTVTAVLGSLCFSFPVQLPLLARFTWDGTATLYAAMTASMGLGAVAGALAASIRAQVGARLLVAVTVAFGLADVLVAAAPTLTVQFAALVVLGAVSVTFATTVSSLLQLAADVATRGRVMALHAVVFLGSRAIGAPAIGWVAEHVDPRASFYFAGVAATLAACWARAAFARAGLSRQTDDRSAETARPVTGAHAGIPGESIAPASDTPTRLGCDG